MEVLLFYVARYSACAHTDDISDVTSRLTSEDIVQPYTLTLDKNSKWTIVSGCTIEVVLFSDSCTLDILNKSCNKWDTMLMDRMSWRCVRYPPFANTLLP